jgi:PEP-CTERM motif
VNSTLKRLVVIVAANLTAAVTLNASALIAPGTSCIDVTGQNSPCTASPTGSSQVQGADPTFNLTDPSVTNLGLFVVPGDVVLFESANGTLADQTTWSDVIHFEDVAGVAGSTATVYFDLDPGINLPPNFVLSTNAVGISENPVGTGGPGDFTTYTAGSAVYNVFSDSPCCEIPEVEKVPEPAAAGLLGMGLIAAFMLRRRTR